MDMQMNASVNVFEHQSTYNPNMPLRGFLYMAAAFKRYIELQRCPLLYEYSLFVAEVRKRTTQNRPLREAIEEAVDYCIAHDILADILRANKAEVTNMCLEEYDEAFHIASEKEISFEEGRLEGLKSAEKERLRAEALDLQVAVLTRKLRGETEESIAESQGITLDEVQKILDEI